MNINLPIEAAQGYKSASQQARVVTEAWTSSNMYCPACVSNYLHKTKDNTAVVDFLCERCDSQFQLKATSKFIGRKIVDAAYDGMIKAIEKNRLPHLLLSPLSGPVPKTSRYIELSLLLQVFYQSYCNSRF